MLLDNLGCPRRVWAGNGLVPGGHEESGSQVRDPARWFSFRSPCFHSRSPGLSRMALSPAGFGHGDCGPPRPSSFPPGGRAPLIFFRVLGVPGALLDRAIPGSERGRGVQGADPAPGAVVFVQNPLLPQLPLPLEDSIGRGCCAPGDCAVGGHNAFHNGRTPGREGPDPMALR